MKILITGGAGFIGSAFASLISVLVVYSVSTITLRNKKGL